MNNKDTPQSRVKFQQQQDISEILSPALSRQYRALEDSVRHVYREFQELDLPIIEPQDVESILNSNISISISTKKNISVEPPPNNPSKLSKRKRILKTTPLTLSIAQDQQAPLELVQSRFDANAVSRIINKDNQANNQNLVYKTRIMTNNINITRWREEETKIPLTHDLVVVPDKVEIIEKKSKKKKKKGKKLEENSVRYSVSNPKNLKRLPLEFFDDSALFETKAPYELLIANPSGVKALSRYHNSIGKSDDNWTWEKCTVLEYDPVKGMYLIEWIDNGKRKWVRRFNILFSGEKLDDFSRRMEYASNARNDFETRKHTTDLILKEAKNSETAPYPVELKYGILRKLGKEISKKQYTLVNELFKELHKDYVFAIKLSEMQLKAETQNVIHQSNLNSEKFAMTALEKSGAGKDDTSKILFRNVAEAARGMSDHMFNANSELQQVLYIILSCLKEVINEKENFFFFSFNSPIDLTLFETMCKSNFDFIHKQLTQEWSKNISNIISTRLGDFFNFDEANMKKYLKSRCKSFMGLVRAIMEGQTHNLVVNGFINFLNLFGMAVEGNGDNPESRSANYLGYAFNYHILKPAPPLRPTRSFFKIAIGLEFSTGETFTDFKSIPSDPINSGNIVVIYPSLAQVKLTLMDLFAKPGQVTTNCIPSVEGLLLTSLPALSNQWIKTVDFEKHQVFNEGSQIMLELLKEAFPKIEILFAKYKSFEFLVQKNDLQSLHSQSPLKDFSEPVRRINSVKHELQALSSDLVEYAPIIFDCGMIKKLFLYLADSSFKAISTLLSNRILEKCQELLSIYQPLSVKIKMNPDRVAIWWNELNDSITNCIIQIENFNYQFEDVQKTWDVMYNCSMQVPEHVNEAYWSTYKWPKQMQVDLEDAKSRLSKSSIDIYSRIQEEKEFVENSLFQIQGQLEYLDQITDIAQSASAQQIIVALGPLVSSAVALAESVTKQEQKMGTGRIKFGNIQDTVDRYYRYEQLWSVVDDARNCLSSWITEWFMNLNAKVMITKVNSWNVIIKNLLEVYVSDSNSRKVVLQLKEDVDNFWRNTNIITTLRNPALKPYHWDQIKEIIGLSLVDFQSLRLSQLVDLDLELVQAVISDISMQADTAHKLEMTLDKMKNALSHIEFQITNYYNSKLGLIFNGTEASSIFEDQLIKCELLILQTVEIDSRQKIEKWASQISRALEMMTVIMEIQDFYGRMKPIFQNAKSLFEKSSLESFAAITKIVSIISEVFSKNRKIINLIYRTDLYDLLMGSGIRMTNCMDGTKNFLMSKRHYFPRFFFLSDLEITKVLACYNSQQLSRFIGQFFPHIHRILDSNGQSTSVKGIMGLEGENIIFQNLVEFSGDVDNILKEIENGVAVAMQGLFKKAITHLRKHSLNGLHAFLANYPFQVSLLSLRVLWSENIASALFLKERQIIKDYKLQFLEVIENLVEASKVAAPASNMKKIESFIALALEYLAIMEEYTPSDSQISKCLVFECDDNYKVWISTRFSRKIEYQFEYLGAKNHLVISPEISSTFCRIMLSISQNYGPLVYAPNGNGKISMLENFSYLLGVRLIPEYCQDMEENRLNLLIQGHLFSSCWVVLHDLWKLGNVKINEIDKIWDSKDSPKPIFATISNFQNWPGISDKIRSKFRLIGLYEPDYQLLLETMLLANHFQNYKDLARKILYFKSSARSILAPFQSAGVGSFKRIVKHAANLRTDHPNIPEHMIISHAISMCFRDSVSLNNTHNLKEIISGIFLNSHSNELNLISSENSILADNAGKYKFVYSEPWAQKVQCIMHAIEQKEPVLIIGENLSGKSTLWKYAVQMLNEKIGASFQVIKAFHTFPNLMHWSKLETGELAKILQEAITDSIERHQDLRLEDKTTKLALSILVLDGDLSMPWFENAMGYMTKTIKDGNHYVSVIYETSTLANSSPSILTRCSNFVYIDSKVLKIDMLISHYLMSSPTHISKHSPFISAYFLAIVIPPLRFMQTDSWPNTSCAEKVVISRIFTMFLALLKEKGDKGYEKFTISEQVLWIFYSMIFCTVWVIGTEYRKEKRVEFDLYFKKFLRDSSQILDNLEKLSGLKAGSLAAAAKFVEGKTVFEVVVGKKLIQWCDWPISGPENPYKLPVNVFNLYPSKDVVQTLYFVKLLLSMEKPILLIGSAGMGKTTSLLHSVQSIVENSKEIYDSELIRMVLSGEMQGEAFQVGILRHLHKKRNNTRGSLDGKRKIIFLDELENSYQNSEGPMESVRMLLETETWYSKKCIVEKVCDIQITGTAKAVCYRPDLSSKWARYFSTIAIDDDAEGKFNEIFKDALDVKLRPIFDPEVIFGIMAITFDTLQTFQGTFKPTPVLPQYRFVMNDAFLIIRTLLNYPLYYSGINALLHQWANCTFRVYRDRLKSDTSIADSIISKIIGKHFNCTLQEITENVNVIYTQPDFLVTDGARKPELRLRNLDLLKNTIKQNFPKLFNEKGMDEAVLEQACHMAFVINNINSNFSFLGLDFGNRSLAANIAAVMIKRIFISYNPSTEDSWMHLIHEIYGKLSENSNNKVLVYLKLHQLNSIQWLDIVSMMKFGVPNRVYDKIQKMSWNAKIPAESFVRDRLRFCFSFPIMKPETVRDIFMRYNTLLSASILFEVHLLSERVIKDKLCFSVTQFGIDIESRLVQNISTFLAWLYTDFHSFAQSEFSQEDPTYFMDHDCIYTAISIFCDHYKDCLKLGKEQQLKCSYAIEKIKESFKGIKDAQDMLDFSKENSKAIAVESQNLLQEIEKDEVALETLENSLKSEHENINRTKEEIAYLQQFCLSEMEKFGPLIQECTRKVQALGRAEIYEIKGIDDPPSCVSSVMEALSALLRFEPKWNETKWESAKRMISEKGFFSSFVNAISEANLVTPVTIHSVERISKSDEFHEATSLEGICVFREWILIVIKYHNMNFSLESKRKLAVEAEQKNSSREFVIAEITQKIAFIHQSHNKKRQYFSSKMKRNEEELSKIKDIDFRLQESQEIQNSLLLTNEKIDERLKLLQKEMQRLLSETLISACFVSFLGPFSGTARKAVVRRWCEKLSAFALPAIGPEFILADQLLKGKPPYMFPLGFYSQDPVFESLIIAKNHKKIPVILDPFFQYQRWIPVFDQDEKVKIYHMDDKDLESNIEKIPDEEGRIFVIFPVEPSFDRVRKIIKLYQQQNTPNNRIFFIMTTEIKNLAHRSEWMPKISFIKVSYCPIAAEKPIEDAICSAHNEELRRKRYVNSNELLNIFYKKEIIFSRLVEFSSSFTPQDMYGGDLNRTLVDVQNQYDTISFRARQIEKAKLAFEDECLPYLQMGRAFANLFEVAYNMHSISKYYLFFFSEFIEICKEKIGALSLGGFPGTIKKYCDQVVKTVYSILCPGYQQHDRTLFSFFFANAMSYIPLFEKEVVWKLPSSSIRFLCFGTIEQKDFFKRKPQEASLIRNPCKSWLSDAKWAMILELSKLPEYQQLAGDFYKCGNRASTPVNEVSWQEIGESRDPLKSEIPSAWQMQLSRAERLLIIKCIRPEFLAHILEDYAKNVLGLQLFDLGIPIDILHQRYKVSNPEKTITLFNQRIDDPINALCILSNSLQLEPPKIISKFPVQVEKLEEIISYATEKGVWIIMDLSNHPSDVFSPILAKVEDIKKQQIVCTASFRLWAIASIKCDNIPRIHFGASLKVFLDDDHEFRTALNEIMKSAIISSKDIIRVDQKTLLFNFSVIFAIIRYRLLGFPYITNNYIHISSLEVDAALNAVSVGLKHSSQNVFGLFQNAFDMIWGSSLRDKIDYEWVNVIFHQIMSASATNWTATDDKTQKVINLPPLKALFESFISAEPSQDKCAQVGRNIEINIQNMHLGENSYVLFEKGRTERLNNSFLLFKTEYTKQSLTLYEDILVELGELRLKLAAVMKQSWFRGSEKRPIRTNPRKDKVITKHLELMTKNNFSSYRKMISIVMSSIEQVMSQIKGICPMHQNTITFLKEIETNCIPTLWKRCGNFYRIKMTFKLWCADLLARLNYTNNWYVSKYESKGGKGEDIIFYDMSKLFSPQDLIPAILLDAALSLDEAIENLDIETIAISERQKSPPERGCYISGLNLYGASFDSHKNVLRDPKPSDVCFKFPLIWLLPKLKVGYDSKQVAALTRKVASKIPVPVFAYKLFITDSDEWVSDNEIPLIGTLYLGSDCQINYWTLRKIYFTPNYTKS